jgi:pimeloyl-ACP methyl ester carboxylesterase
MDVSETVIETPALDFAALEAGDGDDYALLFHGFPDDPGSMQPLMERLAAEGYTAIAPYMRGYGETDRPELTPDNYTIPQLGSDVLAVKNAVGATDPLVIGHDWGAIAVSAVSQLDPDFASECVVMAVPPDFMTAFERHPTQALRSWYMAFFQIPGLAEDTLRRDDFALIERLWRLWSPGWDYSEERLTAVKDTFRTGQTVEASLLYYRAFFEDFVSLPPGELAISGIDVPTLLLGGRNDGCIAASMFDESAACYGARHRTEILGNAGHFLHAERPDEVAELVLAFADE